MKGIKAVEITIVTMSIAVSLSLTKLILALAFWLFGFFGVVKVRLCQSKQTLIFSHRHELMSGSVDPRRTILSGKRLQLVLMLF